MKILLKIGAVFHLLCAVMHIFFPNMYQWSQRLGSLSPEDSAVILGNLNVMNWCMLIFWLLFAVIPFFKSSEVLETSLGKMFLTGIVLFWFIRIAVLQPLVIGLNSPGAIEQVLFLMPGLLLFGIPWVSAVKRKK
ncbi:MAG: hypothetical protein GY754_04940 [bacterium]|nr:hypothetical protein [bacterium]